MRPILYALSFLAVIVSVDATVVMKKNLNPNGIVTCIHGSAVGYRAFNSGTSFAMAE
jgi:hypothetical protein